MILVSACLAGVCSTYRGASNPNAQIEALVAEGKALVVCPEQLGGLATPRPPAEIVGGSGPDVLDGRARVVNVLGEDVTEQFVHGAHETLKLAQLVRAERVIFQERSPSCGVSWIYDGTFSGKLRPGMGVTSALLVREGFRVESADS